jgi:gamma-tubulin complex component 3
LNDVIKIEFNKFVDKLQVQSDISSIELHKNDRNIVYLPKILKPNLQYLQELNGSDTNYERLEHDFNEFTIDQMKLTHHEFLSSIIKHKLINGSDSSSKGKTSGKTYVSQLNSLINTAFRFILTMVELHGVKYDAQYLAPDIHILRREGNIYDNLLKLFQDFNSDLKVFVADLNHDDEMELRYLGISLNQ